MLNRPEHSRVAVRRLGVVGRVTAKYNLRQRRRVDTMLLLTDLVALTVALSFFDPLWTALLVALTVVLLVELSGGYRAQITLSALNDLPRLAVTCLAAVSLISLVAAMDIRLSRVLVVSLGVLAVLFAIRVIYYFLKRRRRTRSPGQRSRTAIVGGGKVAAKLTQSIAEHPELGLEPIVVIDRDPLFDTERFQIPVVPDARLRDVVLEHAIETVIIAFRNAPDSELVSPLREFERLDCEIFIVPRLFEFMHLSADMDRIHTIPLLRVRRDIYRTWYWHCKRLFDFVVALSAMTLLSPVLATTALAVFLSDRDAPIIFRQIRVGRSGTEFTLFKFRSMRPVTEDESDTSWNPDRAVRVNRVGNFIRRTSIDELPQLWNVVRGEMSLVGPRPERPHFVNQFAESIPSYRDRHRVNVGLTGWAAIHGLRGDTSIDDRAIYDNFYIENWSVWLDIKIIILTIRAVFRGSGS